MFCSPHIKLYDDVCRRLAAGVLAIVVSVNYRLAPEHKYPAQHIDGFDVLKFIDGKKQIMPENADLARCFLAGDSAGGNIAHHVAKSVCESCLVLIEVLTLLRYAFHVQLVLHICKILQKVHNCNYYYQKPKELT